MATFLFDEIIFGPVSSRRLGVSLGINLLPTDSKFCSFDCIYCECGWTPEKGTVKTVLPTSEEVKQKLEEKLQQMQQENKLPDVITFAGNGEPTMHPEFEAIIDNAIILRDKYAPNARIAVLSNASRIHQKRVFNALLKVDDNIQKLDSAFEETIRLLDRPRGRFRLWEVVDELCNFEGKVTIQTMFVRGTFNGQLVDNTTDDEINAWLKLIQFIAPRQVMIYTIARDTPLDTLKKVTLKELEKIAGRVRAAGFDVQVSA
jgi:wyosine [tRNA(Phe)-imidazoG37] synthetase (radical SAM superfamily)